MSTSSGYSDSKNATPEASSARDTHAIDSFDPKNITVMVVDYDQHCLDSMVKELQNFYGKVMGCHKASEALSLLRKTNQRIDIILVDVVMPEMDGFKFLEIIGLEMCIPVILMSVQGENTKVLKGVTHGAVDYFIKPVRNEELRSIWQHVYRKMIADKNEQSAGKTGKKPRMIWTPELHQRFVDAVNELGVDEAVPKKIRELMGVPFLRREHIASHLQKYRLYLKQMPNMQSGAMPMYYGGNEGIANSGAAGSNMQSMSPGSSFISSNELQMHPGHMRAEQNQFSPYAAMANTGVFNTYNTLNIPMTSVNMTTSTMSSPMDISQDRQQYHN